MRVRKSPTRRRVGKVSYYQHHGSWSLYYRSANLASSQQVGSAVNFMDHAPFMAQRPKEADHFQ